MHGEDVTQRPSPLTNLVSQKMGIHEWSYDNDTSNDARYKVPWAKAKRRWPASRWKWSWASMLPPRSRRLSCLNCDVQTVFTETACIECDACVDICPTDCLTITQEW